jgi:hypothetical protein
MILYARDESVRAPRRINYDCTSSSRWIIDELVETDLWFGSNAQLGLISQNKLGKGGISATDKLVWMDGASWRKLIGSFRENALHLVSYHGGFPDVGLRITEWWRDGQRTG